MLRKYLTLILTGLTLLSYSIISGNGDIRPCDTSTGNGPKFYLDQINLLGKDKKTFVQFYIQVNCAELQFIRYEGQYQARYNIDIRINDKNDDLVDSQTICDTFTVKSYEKTQSNDAARISRYSISLEPEDYQLEVYLMDWETQQISHIKKNITVPDFGKQHLIMSDIQLSPDVKPAQVGRPFVTEQWYIEPNLTNLFIHGISDTYIYFEIYNIKNAKESNSVLTIDFIIYNKKGKEIRRFNRQVPVTARNMGIKLDFCGKWLVKGDYVLTVQVQQDTSENTVIASEKFSVIR